VGNGLYAFDEQNIRYDVVFTEATILNNRKKVGKQSWDSTLPASFRSVATHKLTLIDLHWPGEREGKNINSPILNAGRQWFADHFAFPLAIGMPTAIPNDLSEIIKDSKSKQQDAWRAIEVNRHAVLGSTDVVKLTFENPDRRLEFWVDLEHGAIPLLVIDSSLSQSYEPLKRMFAN
jgi:hypothetical protein